MSRLRIRVELSHGGMGVPLHKLTSVTGEFHKFLNLLTEDIHIEKQKGDWLVFDFDRENLNFTAEYVGVVAGQHLDAFNSAFDGATSLRRDTIAQFLRITEAISEDEVIGFGLYQSDDTQEPSEWRCLSRRDALRMADEVHLLTGANQESHLPAVLDPGLGARMFGDRRERNLAQTKLVDYVHEVERGLANRIHSVETKVEQQAVELQDVRQQSKSTENSFRNLLATFETFCDQATRKIEHMAPVGLPAASPPDAPAQQWHRGLLLAATVVAGVVALTMWLWLRQLSPETVNAKQDSPKAAPVVQAVQAPPAAPASVPVKAAPPPVVRPAQAAAKVSTTGAESGPAMQVELDATSPSWISMKDADGNTVIAQLLVPGSPQTVTLRKPAILRAGNAGGLVIRLDGKPIGPIGPPGGVRDVEFKDGGFKLSPTQ
jgi:cytoskeletal protein RodZ